MMNWLRSMFGGSPSADASQRRWWDGEFPEWAAPLGSPERLRSFMNLIQRYFEQKAIEVELTPDVILMKSEKGVQQLGYHNLAQMCGELDAVQMRQRVIEHFDLQARILRDGDEFTKQLEDWTFAKERLRVRLWDENNLPKGVKTVLRKDVPGLFSALSVDSPDSVMTAPSDLVPKWGIAKDELFRIALENSLAELSPGRHPLDPARPDGPFAYDDQSFCFTSLVLDQSKLQEMCGKHGAFIALPMRHVILAAPFNALDNLNDLSMLHQMCLGMFKAGPGSLSERIWWVKDGKWIEIEITIRDKQQQVKVPDELADYLNALAASEGS